MSLQAIDTQDIIPDSLPGADTTDRDARARARALLLERTTNALNGRANQAVAWLEDCLAAVGETDPLREPRTFDLAFGLAPRRLGRDPLETDQVARERLRREAIACLPGWHPQGWRLDEAVRVLLLTAAGDAAVPALLAHTLRHADLPEQLALYRALPLFPSDVDMIATVRRGLRTNIRAVFEAIAHDNPWPARHLDEAGWNQMVLKALFVDSALAPIQGLDDRCNADLARMLTDYARERFAAGRPIPDELRRALGPHATPAAVALLDDERGLAAS